MREGPVGSLVTTTASQSVGERDDGHVGPPPDGWAWEDQMANDPSTARAPSLEPDQAAGMVDAGALLVDVREHHEWRAGHAEQAIHLPLAALAERLHELPRDRHLVCVCRSGGRSSLAADTLHRAGYSAWNLTGGMSAWVERSLPVVDASGEPGVVV